jgi:hypothetical protein
VPTGAGELAIHPAGFDYSHHFRRSGAWFPDSRRVIFSAWQNGLAHVRAGHRREPVALARLALWPRVAGYRHICAGQLGGPASIYDGWRLIQRRSRTRTRRLHPLESGWPIADLPASAGLVTEVSAIEVATAMWCPVAPFGHRSAGADAINSAVMPDGSRGAYSTDHLDPYVVDG